MNEILQGYIIVSICVGVVKTFTYYMSHIKPIHRNASRQQIIATILLSFVISTIVAPMIIIEFILGIFKKEEKTI